MSNQKNSTILSIVSGKGGVGKTALSLSLAYELSAAKNKVVMVDLDFPNRGLSELVTQYGKQRESALSLVGTGDESLEQADKSWPILEVSPEIQIVKLPPSGPDLMQVLESRPFEKVRNWIDTLIKEIIEATEADVVVIDCHGSRDVVSYAAAAISDHVFVVSVPEKITFSGTIQFVEGFRSKTESAPNKPKLHILFNNVMKGFSRRVLSYWYKKYFKRYFDDNDFLLLIPFDPKVSIATSKELFPTKKLHYSAMAEKIRILLFNIFQRSANIKVRKEARFVAKVMQPFIRARKPILSEIVDEKIPIQILILSVLVTSLTTTTVAVLATLGVPLISLQELQDQNIVLPVAIFFAFHIFVSLWLISAFIARTTIDHDAMVSGELGHNSWENYIKAIYRTAYTLFGVIIISKNVRLFPTSQKTIEEVTFLLELLGLDILTPVLSTTLNFVGIISIIMLCVIAVIFLIRSIRTLLFRIWSGETLYRLVVLAGIISFWYLSIV